MSNVVHEIRYEAAQDLLGDLLPWSGRLKLKDYVFRGHASSDFDLVPTSVRNYGQDKLGGFQKNGIKINGVASDSEFSLVLAEYRLLRDFYRKADSCGLNVPRSDILRERLYEEFDSRLLIKVAAEGRWLPVDMLESAALAQHYGIPTRLLDWTYDPFVAAFFSSLSLEKKDGDLCIWALNRYYMGVISSSYKGCPFSLVTPHYSGNPNLAAQKGLFSHWATELPGLGKINDSPVVDRRPLDELICSYFDEKKIIVNMPVFYKMLLPAGKARDLALCLRDLGYGSAKIFPGYAGVAAEMLNLDHLHFGWLN